MEVLIRHVVGNFLYLLHKKQYLLQVFKEIKNKQGDSNKEFSWENVFEKSKKNSMPIREFRVF